MWSNPGGMGEPGELSLLTICVFSRTNPIIGGFADPKPHLLLVLLLQQRNGLCGSTALHGFGWRAELLLCRGRAKAGLIPEAVTPAQYSRERGPVA
jgi:hypothetical protein